jgi:hypothetical protein
MTWQVPHIWQGGDVWIIGGGPSIPKQFEVPEEVFQSVMKGNSPPSVYSPYMSYLHDKHVIGVNAAYLLGNWIDIVFFGDKSFFLAHEKRLKDFPGIKVSCQEYINNNGWCKFVAKDPSHRVGISPNPKMVSWNNNSGAAAISLAVHTGAKRIILLGFDMTLDSGKQHWHSLYPNSANNQDERRRINTPFARHLLGFPAIAADADRMGVEILNANPNSAIACFKKVTVKELMQ